MAQVNTICTTNATWRAMMHAQLLTMAPLGFL